MTEQDKKLQLPLLFIRLSVFLVMFMWTIDKLINPAHALKVYESFYYIAGLDVNVMYVIAAIELVILLKFVAGYKKKYTYGAVLVLHAVSTLSSFKQYLAPFTALTCYFLRPGPCWQPVSHYSFCGIWTRNGASNNCARNNHLSPPLRSGCCCTRHLTQLLENYSQRLSLNAERNCERG